jgi:hypothetical protein
MDYSENKPVWPGSSSFAVGQTPFGFFDNDTIFQQHADKFAKFAAQHIGYPIMDVELQDINFYTAFEAAVIEYSNQVNQVNIVNNLVNTLGIQTGSSFMNDSGFTGALVGNSFGYITKLSKAYGTEAESGGDTKWFDPFVGTGLGSQQLLDAFDFGGFSPSVNFMMMPLHADLLRIQTIEFNDRIRKSHYTFDIHGDDIRLYPVPTKSGSNLEPFFDTVWFEFMLEEDKANDAVLFGNTALTTGAISDASNIPYTYQQYNTINDMGRAWIIRYGSAIAKEMLGYIRSKYSSVPIPNGEVTLNGSDLVSQGQSEKDALITQLREFLEKMTKEQMLTRQNTEATQINEMMAKIPLRLYVG